MQNKKKQEGIVLFMSLLMLLLLTVLGVSSIQTASLQQRMARYSNDASLAFQAAEAALRDGEDLLEGLTSLADFGDKGNPDPTAFAGNEANGYYYREKAGVDPNWRWNWGLVCDGGFRESETVITVSQFNQNSIVEHIRTVFPDSGALNLDNIGQDTGSGRTHIFRVTARGTGGTATVEVMLQGTYGVRF
ncbi:MAG: pilus assembly PilX family protein [Candidatus Azotimanducaceae bacterium WSBS_2022_MAG_OTU7]